MFFNKILQWIREWMGKLMIGSGSVKSAFNVDVAITPYMATALQLWSFMYVNRAYWLNQSIDGHSSGDRLDNYELRSLNLPAAIAGEISRAVTIELKIEISGSARADFLSKQMERVLPQLRREIEYGCAKGGLMFKPYINGDQINVDYVQADQFYPISFDTNGNIISCVFADQRTIGHNYYTRLEYHAMTENGCEIRNQAFKSTAKDVLGSPVPLSIIPEWAEIEEQATIKNIDKPLFAYFRFPLANNIDPTSPLGVSCYSRVVELIHDADKQWSELLWEFESGERAIFVDVLAFGKDKNGQPKLPNRRLYRGIDSGEDADMFHDWTPDFREASILSGLDAILKKVEFNCGLSYGVLSDPQSVEKTATEITSTQQRFYATIADTQKALQHALEQLVWSMDVWTTIGNLAPKGNYELAFDFDDSIVIDREAQMMQDQQTVGMGAMPKWMFLVRNYGLTENIAKQWVTDFQSEQPKDLFNDPANQGA